MAHADPRKTYAAADPTVTARIEAGRIGVLALLWLTGVYLRAPILVGAPLGGRIADALALGPTALGALTTLPVLMLGAAAVPAAWLIARLGPRAALTAALALVTAASAARGVAPDATWMLLATAVTGLGVAVMQPALPAIVARWCPGYTALAATVYLNGMMVGEFIGAGLTLPVLLPLAGGSWRLAFGLLSLPAIVVLGLLYLPARATRHKPEQTPTGRIDWRDGTTWRYGTLLGVTAATFFGLNAYMPSLVAERHMTALLDDVFALFNATQLVTSLLLIGLIRRVLAIPRLMFATLVCHIAGLALVLTTGGCGLMIGAVLVSFASALQLITLTSLPAMRLAPAAAARLAAGMFAIGYGLAFVLPLIGGGLVAWSGRPDAVVGLFAALNLACLWPGWQTRV